MEGGGGPAPAPSGTAPYYSRIRIRVSRQISQEVCPWNVKFARAVTEPALAPRAEIADLTLDEWAAMDEAEWKRRTQGTAIRRAKWEGFRRNLFTARARLSDD